MDDYSLRKPVPNRYNIRYDTDEKMLECPDCECRIISGWFSLAVGNKGYSFCPYCGSDLRKPEQTSMEI